MKFGNYMYHLKWISASTQKDYLSFFYFFFGWGMEGGGLEGAKIATTASL